MYIVGSVNGTISTNLAFFTNSSSYHQNFGGGTYDGFLVKFNPQGAIVWGSFIGGENDDVVSEIALDSNDNIYIYYWLYKKCDQYKHTQ